MKKDQNFVRILSEFIEDAIAISNNDKKLTDTLMSYFSCLFGSYRVFIAQEYNFLFSLFNEKKESGEKYIAVKKDEFPEIPSSFLVENLKFKSNSNKKEFYISTFLYKNLIQHPVYSIGNIEPSKCPLCYKYLINIKSKNTLLGMINIQSFKPVFSRNNLIYQLKMFQGSISNLFETFHIYRDFDIKINEFMKLKDSTEMIIESIDLGIIVMEYHNKLRAINKKALQILGIDRSIPDFDLNRIINDRFHENIMEIISYNLKTSETSIKLFDKEYRNQNIIKRIDLVISPYKDINNKITGFIIIIDDITERKKYEEKLLRQEKLASLGQVIAGVAHEINTPLAGIRSYSQLLRESILNKELKESSEYTDKIIAQVDRCSTIIDELLSFARKKKANKTYFNLNDLVKEAVSVTDTIIKDKEISISIVTSEKNSMIFGDRGKIEQVILNLVLNAKDAIEKKGEIDISIDDKEDLIEIVIRDNGKGIPDEDLFRIFDPFFTTKKKSGTGLGLSLSYGVIKDHNGDIKVRSELGKGTEFIITFPKS